MSEETTESKVLDYERGWTAGHRAVWTNLLGQCLRELGYNSLQSTQKNWIIEREEASRQLRKLCAEFGDNDWNESASLGDVIEKHLGQYLNDQKDREDPDRYRNE